MKKAILAFLLITAFLGAKAQDEPKLPPDIDMLKFFYTYYMLPYIDGSKPTEFYSKQYQMRKRYCTARCLARYEQLMQIPDSIDDPFIKAAGSDREAIISLAFAKDPKQPNKYTVTYNAGEEKISIELSLVNDKGDWKVDYLY
ncbi:hypothetical protein GCM10027049_21340 [Mucilaginibacter puniceus]